MNCYRYDDSGRLISCEDYGPAMQMQPPPSLADRVAFRAVPYTRRERRRIARRKSGPGRRCARHVRLWYVPTPRIETIPEPVVLRAHLLSEGRGYQEVMLYLREGIALTRAHCDDVTRADGERTER